MISDNDLQLSISGDKDVDLAYTVPKIPSYCPPTDTEELMAEDKQNDAYEDSPPPSQPRPLVHNTNESSPPE